MPEPHPTTLNEPVDPDTGPRAPTRPAVRGHRQGPVVAVVALGGAAGAVARYGASLLWPTPPGAFPWTTLLVNALGCAAIGVLMAVLAAAPSAHRLVRPFLGTGVLGGFTTFSTYAVDIQRLVGHGEVRTGLAYLALTLLAALAAVWAAAVATRCVLSWRQQ
ncbi:fluoride efflux transporter CrcB [Streptomyces sp. NPDC053560]|uniref:fluoride efflux transporter CrcB n=1 Tax=Streptomyces sp. NPDC053560 TaxID=3365711 RepID=UPI0037CFA688